MILTQKPSIINNEQKKNKFPLVSIVITGRNEKDTIEKCITSVINQTYPNFEIIYIDSKSSDGTFEIAVRLQNYANISNCRGYLSLSLETNSPAGGRNYGVKYSSGSIIAFIDADCVAESDWLENLIKYFSNDTMIVGGPNILRHIKDTKIIVAIEHILGTFFATGGSAQFMKIEKLTYVRALSTCNLAIQKKLFVEIGGFDESLRYNEDSDLCHRLRKKGYKILYSPEAIVNHFMGIENYSDLLKVFKKYGYERGKNVAKKPYLLTKSNLLSIASCSTMIFLLTLSLLFKSGETILLFLILIFVIVVFIFSIKLAIKKRSPTLFFLGPLIYTSIHSVYSISFIGAYVQETANIIKSRLKELLTKKFSYP